MSTSLFEIAGHANYALIFNTVAAGLGFGSAGEIDRFLFNAYGKAIEQIKKASRPRGVIFVLEPASVKGAIGDPLALKPLLMQIISDKASAFYSLRIDLAGGLKISNICAPEDRRLFVNDEWQHLSAQHYSRKYNKCVVWANGISVSVFIAGDIYCELKDVIEGLYGLPCDFNALSWKDGKIFFDFADCELNDRGPRGIWLLPEKYLLIPKPEVQIRAILGKFLQYRLAGYRHHSEESHVENEGCADIILYLINGRIFIIEIKWIGCALIGRHFGATEAAIKDGIAKNPKIWITKFNEKTINSGIRQLVRYFNTGNYNRAYLAVFDCSESAKLSDCSCLPIPTTDLDGNSAADFRILRACVDPRPASKRAR